MEKKEQNVEGLNVSPAIAKPMLPAVHYAPSGEWGGERVNCNRHYTTDVKHTGLLSKVTCKKCLSKHSR